MIRTQVQLGTTSVGQADVPPVTLSGGAGICVCIFIYFVLACRGHVSAFNLLMAAELASWSDNRNL